jgi:elongation factor P hydroxylase
MTDSKASRIARTFNRTFYSTHGILMQGGGAEPLYEPASGARPARIVHTYDYPASALHEAAHWCIAGTARRRQRDYGYWYVPGPRDRQQRAAFFAAEANVQALEAVFARTCGVRFVVSADDFAAGPDELERFARAVDGCIEARLHTPLPGRARRFRDALRAEFARGGG